MVVCLLALLAQDPVLPPTFDELPVEPFRASGRVTWWWPAMRGRGTPDSSLGIRNALDEGPGWSYDRNTGLDGRGSSPMLEVGVSWGWEDGRRVNVSGVNLLHWEGEWSASEILGEAKDLGTAILPAGTPMDSTLEVTRYGIEYVIMVGFSDSAGFRIGGTAGFHILRAKFRTLTPMGVIEDDISTGPFSGGLQFEMQPTDSPVSFSGGVRFSGFSTGFFEAWIGSEARSGPVEINAGWRGTWHSGNIHDVIKIALTGPYLGVTVRF